MRITRFGRSVRHGVAHNMRPEIVSLSRLGVGIYALNYVGNVFTAAVFEADVFDDIFDGMVDQNDEGGLVIGRHRS